jgi:hypothetical protein
MLWWEEKRENNRDNEMTDTSGIVLADGKENMRAPSAPPGRTRANLPRRVRSQTFLRPVNVHIIIQVFQSYRPTSDVNLYLSFNSHNV